MARLILNLRRLPGWPGTTELPAPQRAMLDSLLDAALIESGAALDDIAADIAEIAAYNGLGGDEADDPWPDAVLIDDGPLGARLVAALRAVCIPCLTA